MGEYPPGTTRRDLVRAGIAEPRGGRPTCPECDAVVVDTDDHADECEADHLDQADIAEFHAEQAERSAKDADAVREERAAERRREGRD